MKIASAICFSVVTAVAGALLPISSSSADDTAPTDAQDCVSGTQSTDAPTPNGPYTCGERDHKPQQDPKHDKKPEELK